jgi:hypothetical protein
MVFNMNTKVIQHASINPGTTAGAKVYGTIPTTGTHTALYLRCLTSGGVALTAAQIASNLANITIRLDGEQIIQADAQFLLALQQYYAACDNAANVAGVLPIFYTRRYLPTPEQRVRTALGMNGKSSYAVEIDLGSTITQITGGEIQVFAERLDVDLPLGEHIVIKKIPQSYGSIGTHEITDLPGLRDASKAYLAIHAYCTTGSCVMSKAAVIANSADVFSALPADLQQVRLERAMRDPQSNYYHIDFALQNHYMSRLRMGNIVDFRQQLTFTGAAPTNYTLYTEQLVDIGDDKGGFAQ